MITRQRLVIGAGNKGDTGAPVFGKLVQLRLLAGADTGVNINTAILPKVGDSGEGYIVHTRVINTDFDTGFPIHQVRYLAGERLRVKASNDTGVVTPNHTGGTMYAWFESE